MVGLCNLYAVLHFSVLVLSYRDECYHEVIQRGRSDCVNIAGTFVFTQKDACNPLQFKNVVRLSGTLNFTNQEVFDPMSCLPNLQLIIVPDTIDNYAIEITNTVTGVQNFYWNTSLVIYNKAKKYIKIDALDFEMDAKQYKAMAARYGQGTLEIPKAHVVGECWLKNPIVFLSELNACDSVVGDLRIDRTLQARDTNTTLSRVSGCVIIENSDLNHEEMDFISRIKTIECAKKTRSIIRGNKKFCPSSGFLTRFSLAHVSIERSEKEKMVSEIKSKNADNKTCNGLCFSQDIESEFQKCKVLFGDLQLTKKIIGKLSEVTTLYGRLIADGFETNDLFKVLPKLSKIISKPAIEIVHNYKLSKVQFPKDLKIQTKAAISIRIKDNFFYKMEKKEYDELASIHGDGKLDIDFLKEGECYFSAPLKNISEMDNCHTIFGDLVLNGEVGNKTTALPKLITGCIRVNGTSLEHLLFLRHASRQWSHECISGHVITFNKNLCTDLWLEKLKKTNDNSAGRKMLVMENKDFCGKSCKKQDLDDNLCAVLDGKFYMSVDEEDRLKSETMLAGLEESGPVLIRETGITDTDSLLGLITITVEDEGPGIELSGNKNLTSVDLNMNIVSASNSSVLIRIRNNGEYKMAHKQYKALVEKYGEERLDIDHKEDKSWDAGIGIGIGISLLLVLSACIALFGVGVWKVKRKNHVNKKIVDSPHNKVKCSTKKLEFSEEGRKHREREEEEKRAEVPTVKSTMKSTLNNASNAAVTVNSAEIEHDGMLRDNVSVMKAKGGKSVLSAAKTADLATVGGKEFETKSQYNASVMMSKYSRSSVSKAKTAEPANLGGKGEFFGQLVDNKSQYNKPKTAPLAAVGKKEEYKGQERNNASVMVNGGAQKKYAPSVYVTNAQK